MKLSTLSPQNFWNILFLVSLVALAGAIGFNFLMPAPILKPLVSFARVKNFDRADSVSKEAKKRVESKLWDLDSQELGGSVLSSLNTKAEANHVQMSDFRIDKTIRVNSQREAPFVVVLDGDFKDVMHLLNSLESPDSKLCVSMLQMASSDRGSGFVKATLSVTAFLRKAS